jgi:PPE-repeat protein
MIGLTGPGEIISGELWGGPPDGASTFFATAIQLESVVGQIMQVLDGQQVNAGVMTTAWASPTGAKAVSSNAPYGAWLGQMAGHVTTAATQIRTAGMAFDTAKAMTRTPVEFAALDTACATLIATNILGINTPAIIANRVVWTLWTALAVTGMAHYTAASAPVHALAELPVAPASSIPGASLTPSISEGLAGTQPIAQAMQGAAGAGASALPSVGSAAVEPVSAVSQLLSPSTALLSPSSALAEAPSAASGLSSVASAPMSAMSSVGSPGAGSGGAGAGSSNWLGAMGAGGTVAASLSGGGVGGLGGLGGVSGLAGIRPPGSWNSAVSAAPEADQAMFSRISEARAASATPATSGGMGAPGMAQGARQASAEREREGDGALAAAAAVLYRPPKDMPVVTGAAGAQFVAGEGGQ